MHAHNSFNAPFLALPKWACQKIGQANKGSALQVLCTMVEHMNIKTKTVTISMADLSEQSGLSKETVKRCVRWLTDEGILRVIHRVAEANKYCIQYQQVGSPMTLPHQNESEKQDENPVENQGYRVTHDPTKQPKNIRLAGTSSKHNRIVIESISNEILKRVCDDQEGASSLILGSDPEETVTPPVKNTVNKKKPQTSNPRTNDLVRYFVQHKAIVMKIIPPTELMILRKTMKQLLNSGLSPETVRKMVDRFFTNTRLTFDRGVVLPFASRKIQNRLLEEIGEVQVLMHDPVLALMAKSFVRDEPLDVPWAESSDQVLQEAIITRCLEAVYRYPELVAEIARHWAGDFRNPQFIESLMDLESLVNSGLGRETVILSEILERLSYLHLPTDLVKGKVRDSAGTMAVALYENGRSAHA